MARHTTAVEIALAFLVLACGDDGTTAAQTGSGGNGTGASVGSGATGGSGGGTAGGGGGMTTCGNGQTDANEACDGGMVDCASLAATWTSGMAACRTNCSGFDVDACTLAMPGSFEVVKPADRDAKWSTARCNDGTPYSFLVRLASSPSTEWMIYLQGGVLCDDNAFSCAQRLMNSPALTTTDPSPDRAFTSSNPSGVFSANAVENPDFFDANQVWGHYCSSDFWAGDSTDLRPSSAASNGWYFSGHTNVASMMAVLIERYGLDDGDAQLRVLFGGGSAGAFGAHLNADLVATTIPSAAGAGRLLLFVDAGWMTDWDDAQHRLGAATQPDDQVWDLARTFWAATFDPTCEAAQAVPGNCMLGPVWYPYVSAKMPTLIQQSSIDSSFLGVHGISFSMGGMTCAQSNDVAACNTWQSQVQTSLAGAPWLFSGGMPYHVLGTSNQGLGLGPNGSTLREVLSRFWAGMTPEQVVF